MRHFVAERRDVLRQIRDNPYIATMYVRGETPDDEEASRSFVCTLTLGAQRAVTAERFDYGMTGELPTAMSYWALLTTYDAPEIKTANELLIQQAVPDAEAVDAEPIGYSPVEGAVTRRFDVIIGTVYPYKKEALIREKQ